MITLEILEKQNAETSNAIIDFFLASSSNSNSKHNNHKDKFIQLAKYEGELTVQRDKEDDEKLQVGIDYAKEKGVIDPNFVPQPYIEVDVLGKTPDEVARVILDKVLPASKEETTFSGIICVVGLSGTGKGTTVAKLGQHLEQEHGKQVVTWSNGNIFRSVTLLAATWAEQQQQEQQPENGPVDIEKALTKENLAMFMNMLSFGKFAKSTDSTSLSYDTRIQGLGLDLLVSQVQNTELKLPKVSKHIPKVAQVTQGEVILFAAKAVQQMTTETPNLFVLLEGRAQTVNYVPTPHRFCLILSDESLIGKRRAAQRLMAQAWKDVKKDNNNKGNDSAQVVETALLAALDLMVEEIH